MNPDKSAPPKKAPLQLTTILLALLAVVILADLWSGSRGAAELSYDQFTAALEAGEIQRVAIGDRQISGEFLEERDGDQRFVVNRVDPELAATLDTAGVEFEGRIENRTFETLLSWILPLVLFVGVWLFLMRRFAGKGPGSGLMSIGKSKAKVYVEHDTQTTFDDVAGADEAKDELAEIVAFLRDPQSYGRLGARMPKGVLLVGPPGTGKTLMARAVAGEAQVPFFSISGSEFVEMFVGVGAARVRDLFEQARAKAPCIIFVDELDALGGARHSAGLSGGHDEKEQTLNQLLVELDGFDPSGGIVLLAATNRPDVLDPALLRAGRFDRQVLVDRPDRLGRTAILEVHLKKIKLGSIDTEELAALTPGFTGADLANLVNEAALVATRRGAVAVERKDFTAAVERIVAGLEKRNRLLREPERKVVAYHEMGHALVAAALPSSDPVHKVSIIPRGIGALGYTLQRPTEDRFLMTRAELSDRLAVLMGGRAAEQLVFGEISTGAADDLAKATDMARAMVTQYAMVPELGLTVYQERREGFLGAGSPVLGPKEYSDGTADQIDRAVRQILQQAFDHASAVLEASRGVLEESATVLLDQETLDDVELTRFLERAQTPPIRAVS